MNDTWPEQVLWEWDWGIAIGGDLLHHAKTMMLYDDSDETRGMAVTSCGRRLSLLIPGVFTRMGALRCDRCCDALGYPRGRGSPKNDASCRPIAERRLRDLGLLPTKGESHERHL